MSDASVSPDLAGFLASAAGQRVVPVSRVLLADSETPIGVYRKLAGGPGTFLLESAENGRSWSRYSYIGVRSQATLTEADGVGAWIGEVPAGLRQHGNPLQLLRQSLTALAGTPDPQLPPLSGGLVGYFSYDIVSRFEPTVGCSGTDDVPLPELGLMLATDLAVLDHTDGTIILIANAVLDARLDADPGGKAPLVTDSKVDADAGEAAPGPQAEPDGGRSAAQAAYHRAVGRLEAMTTALSRPVPPGVSSFRRPGPGGYRSNMAPGRYQQVVRSCKNAIVDGECFQIVPSQRFEVDTDADPLDVYRVLRTTNPSPYMYLLTFEDFAVVGSSPEAHVQVRDSRALLRPLAGTRPRGQSPEADEALAAQLLADEKERAEHVMLVDLGRNDLGRVCTPGSVDVVQLMGLERYSHVMHIVSTVVGELAEGRDALDVIAATFPAGTLSGAPKVRAMQIIDELEPNRRGLYAGTVGYFDLAGNLDMAIAIRTALMRGGKAFVQAGAGIVADSDPDAEDAETRAKAAAVLGAIASAQTMTTAR